LRKRPIDTLLVNAIHDWLTDKTSRNCRLPKIEKKGLKLWLVRVQDKNEPLSVPEFVISTNRNLFHNAITK
jgi:hypothetical protein